MPDIVDISDLGDFPKENGTDEVKNTQPTVEPEKSQEAPEKPAAATMSPTGYEGVDSYLESIGIKDGKIEFEGDESYNFNELTPEIQKNILESTINKKAQEMGNSLDGLEDSEIQVINAARTAGVPINEYLDKLVDSRVANASAYQASQSADFDNMEDRSIYMKFLKRENPDITDEQLEEELTQASSLASFKSITGNLRKDFKREQLDQMSEQERIDREKATQEIEGEKTLIANAAVGFDRTAGFTVTDDEREGILEELLVQVEDGDTKFVDRITSDPRALVKAAYWERFGEEKVTNLISFYEEELAKVKGQMQDIQSSTGKTPLVRKTSLTREPKGNIDELGGPERGNNNLKVVDISDL